MVVGSPGVDGMLLLYRSLSPHPCARFEDSVVVGGVLVKRTQIANVILES